MRSSRLAAGLRVLLRHLRYSRGNPVRVLRIGRRVAEIVARGQLAGVLARHRVIGDMYADYAAWARQDDARSTARARSIAAVSRNWPHAPTFSVLMPVYAPDASFLAAAIASVTAQTCAQWELIVVDDGSPSPDHHALLRTLAAGDARIRLLPRERNGGIVAATNDALAAARGDYCLFMDQDDLLAPWALHDFAARIVSEPGVQVLYADQDYVDPAGTRAQPFFKPDFDAEWLRTTNYVLHPVVVRTSLLREVGGLRTGTDGVQDWDLMLRLAGHVREQDIAHVSHVLYHWRQHAGSTAATLVEDERAVSAQRAVVERSIAARGDDAIAIRHEGGWWIRYAIGAVAPRVAVVVPTRDRADLLARCAQGLLERTRYPSFEVVLVDNGTVEPAALALLAKLRDDPRVRVVAAPGDFNYSRLCNAGVQASAADIVVLYNNDVEPLHDGWLEEMVGLAQRPDIGVVGALLYYPDDTIQHAGVILGINGVADRPYLGYPRGFRGVDNRLASVHTVSAVITACAAVRRDAYVRVGGMDETFPVACNDLDFCLRIAATGLRNVLTPHAALRHLESASRGYGENTSEEAQPLADERRFAQRWSARLARDPMYNDNLCRSGTAFALRRDVPE